MLCFAPYFHVHMEIEGHHALEFVPETSGFLLGHERHSSWELEN